LHSGFERLIDLPGLLEARILGQKSATSRLARAVQAAELGLNQVGPRIYAVFRSFCEFFREPDPQLGFLWGHMTMGMVLCIPLFIAGVGFATFALRRKPLHSS
jgi:hypothetical protein